MASKKTEIMGVAGCNANNSVSLDGNSRKIYNKRKYLYYFFKNTILSVLIFILKFTLKCTLVSMITNILVRIYWNSNHFHTENTLHICPFLLEQ